MAGTKAVCFPAFFTFLPFTTMPKKHLDLNKRPNHWPTFALMAFTAMGLAAVVYVVVFL